MSFTGQFQPRDIRQVSGHFNPETGIVYVGLDVGHSGESTGWDRVTFEVVEGQVATMRLLLAAMVEAVDALEGGAKLRHKATWPPVAEDKPEDKPEGGGAS